MDLEYDWDPEKVVVLTKLERGSCPSMSEYKTSLMKVTPTELMEYLEKKKDETT